MHLAQVAVLAVVLESALASVLGDVPMAGRPDRGPAVARAGDDGR